MAYFVKNIRNNFDFFLRNHITFSRKNYAEKPEELNILAFNQEQKNFYENLKQKYNFENIENATQKNFLQNLYYLNIFDKYFLKKQSQKISVLDIGSKNWEYVKSEYTFLNSFTQDYTLNGIELDAYRMCSGFYTRYEISKFYTKGLSNTNYIIGDFLEHSEKYDYIIWILPFVTEYPLMRWGLPLKYFKPEQMLQHAYDLLKTGGELLIINQGEEEYKIQQDLNAKLNIPAEYYGEINDVFEAFKHKRYCSKIVK